MPRYIDAEKAAERLNACMWGKDYDAALARQCIDDTPTADVVDVVHCKDCSWFQLKRIRRKKFDSLFECILWGNSTTSEFYCAAGERRDDAVF